MTITVLLADDSEIMRKGIVTLLKSDLEIQVVAEASSLSQTMQCISKFQPQIVVMDIHMGDENAFTWPQVRSSLNGASLLAISLWNDDQTLAIAKRFGAAVLLDKAKLTHELISVIKRCAKERRQRG